MVGLVPVVGGSGSRWVGESRSVVSIGRLLLVLALLTKVGERGLVVGSLVLVRVVLGGVGWAVEIAVIASLEYCIVTVALGGE